MGSFKTAMFSPGILSYFDHVQPVVTFKSKET